jgi:hypothetical protein
MTPVQSHQPEDDLSHHGSERSSRTIGLDLRWPPPETPLMLAKRFLRTSNLSQTPTPSPLVGRSPTQELSPSRQLSDPPPLGTPYLAVAGATLEFGVGPIASVSLGPPTIIWSPPILNFLG